MRAVVLCAGLGTRLSPLTDRLPKPLVPVANRAILDLILDRLGAVGIEDVGLNLHHMAPVIEAHVALRRNGRPRVHTVYEPEILDTGGGIAHFRAWGEQDGALLVHNADIVTDLDITSVIDSHQRTGAAATLALVDDPRFNAVGIDEAGRVLDIRGTATVAARLTLCGVYILSRCFLQRLEPHRKASVVPALREQIAREPGSVRAVRIPASTYWRDLGHMSAYLDLHRDILEGRGPCLPGVEIPPGGVMVAPDATLAPGARLSGCVAIGPRCAIGRDVCLSDCVVLAGTRLQDGFAAHRAVILDDLVIAA